MSTLPHNSQSDEIDLFGHLLEYQQTEEFADESKQYQDRWHKSQRQNHLRNSHVYRQRHPDSVSMRSRASKYKDYLFERQNGECAYCGTFLSGRFHIDHIIPLIKGGTNNLNNLCVCCPTCNARKGTKLPR